MKKQTWQKWIATGLSLFLITVAYGGSSKDTIKSVVSFGDSLSDAGTYSVTSNHGGGKFTTNPGKIWVENVASYYGSTILPAESSGFGQVATTNNKGYAYGQGGARIKDPIGIDHDRGETTLPLISQMDNYIKNHKGFDSTQLVLIQAGPNDIFTQLSILAQAPTLNETVVKNAQFEIDTAARQLVGDVIGEAIAKGATNIVVMGAPDLGAVPAFAADLINASTATAFSKEFNTSLLDSLSILQAEIAKSALPVKIIYVDIFAYLDEVVATNNADHQFTHKLDAVACSKDKIINKIDLAIKKLDPKFPGSAFSLYCAADTLTEDGADTNYMFADAVHPTTGLHKVLSNYVIKQVEAAFQ